MQDARELSHPILEVALRLSPKETVPGLLIQRQIAPDGVLAVIDFEQSRAPRLPIGERVSLIFTGDFLEPRELTGEVVYRSENELLQRYQFRFAAEARVPLGSAGDRRRAVRVEPDPAAPLIAFLQSSPSATPFEVAVRDISARGARVQIPPAAEAELFATSRLRIGLRLPDGIEELQFQAVIRYRARIGDEIHYGIEFDASRTEDFGGQQEQVAIYVLGRRSELDASDERDDAR